MSVSLLKPSVKLSVHDSLTNIVGLNCKTSHHLMAGSQRKALADGLG